MEKTSRAVSHATETRVTESCEGHAVADVRVPALTVLAHPDITRVGERVILPELAGKQEVLLSRTELAFAQPGSELARTLDSPHLSRSPLRLAPDAASGGVAVERGSSPTPVAVDGDALDERRLLGVSEVARGVVLLLGRRVALLLHLDAAVTSETPSLGMVGESLEMRRLRDEARIAARLDVPVLLRGESGTGKELLARAVHEAGRRAEGTYLAVNMAAIPPALAASELFGATKGAFTGADRKKEGYFERADGGTLFLDEIGETPDEVQPLLLRALENGEIQPVGSAAPRRVDTRVIAATDADLKALAERGTFRKPLLHRLAGYEIRLPPLRERRADFGRLLVFFLRRELERLGAVHYLDNPNQNERPWPSASLVAKLACCDWPGNIRQLKNVVRRMAIAQATNTLLRLDPELLGAPGPSDSRTPTDASEPPSTAEQETSSAAHSGEAPPPPGEGWRRAYRKPSEVSDKELLATLRDHHFELKATADALGISRGSLYNLVASHPRVQKATELERGEIEIALERAGGELEAAAAELEVSAHALKRRLKALRLAEDLTVKD